MLRDEGGGVVVDQDDAAKLKQVITAWADDRASAVATGQKAREVFEQNYTKDIGLGNYQRILEAGK